MYTDKQFDFERDVAPWLAEVTRPARYTGGEYNSVADECAALYCALCFPELYEVAMSNLGIRILYEALNSCPGIAAERVFAPWPDMEEQLRSRQLPLYTLETKRPLYSCDMIGFTLQYELTYTNLLNVLELGGVPLHSSERGERVPLVIAGGPCSYNPAPLEPFVDAFYIGEGDSAVREIAQLLLECKENSLSRSATLDKLAGLDYLYLPGRSGSVLRKIEPELDPLPFPVKQLVPNIRTVQDRGMIEVSRGCTNGCRFCHAGMTYRPVRERSCAEIVRLAEGIVDNTGFTEISLASLSISDYSRLPELISCLNSRFKNEKISFNLPSLRIDGVSLDTPALVGEIRKSGLTFAVEAGSDQLRLRLNKRVDREHLYSVLQRIAAKGWNQIKLYFMIGFPGCSDEAEDIISFVCELRRRFKKISIRLTVGPLVPKPLTPFQWSRQMSIEAARAAVYRIRERFDRDKKVRVSFNSPEMSFLEGVFARGGRQSAAVLLTAYRNGARFDGWDDRFDWTVWQDAIQQNGYDVEDLLDPFGGDPSAELPWDAVSGTADKQFLQREWLRYLEGGDEACSPADLLTEDCRTGSCHGCGVCTPQIGPLAAPSDPLPEQLCEPRSIEWSGEEQRTVYRVNFAKRDVFRFTSHLDLQQHLLRILLRSKLPVSFTNGFNPKPRVAITAPLPLGISSRGDLLELELSRRLPEEVVLQRLRRAAPGGLFFDKVRQLDGLKSRITERINLYRFECQLPVNPEPLREWGVEPIALPDGAAAPTALFYPVDDSRVPKVKEFLERVYGQPFYSLCGTGLCRSGLFCLTADGGLLDGFDV